jgi:hypothetical protein
LLPGARKPFIISLSFVFSSRPAARPGLFRTGLSSRGNFQGLTRAVPVRKNISKEIEGIAEK